MSNSDLHLYEHVHIHVKTSNSQKTEAKDELVPLNYEPILMSEPSANVIKLGCLNDGLLKRGQFSF